MGAKTDVYGLQTGVGLALGLAPADAPAPCAQAPLFGAAPRDESGHDRAQAAAVDISVVLLDADDVLYDASAWYRWLAQMFARLEPGALEVHFASRWRNEFLPPVHRGQCAFYEALARCLASLGLAPGLVEEVLAAARAQRRRQDATLRPLPGVRTTLNRLHCAGITLGVLTATDRSVAALRHDLARLGLDAALDHIQTTSELGMSLAEPDCFCRALAAIAAAPTSTLFVGHSDHDVRGAHAAGLRTVAFNAHRCVPYIAHLDRFDELLTLVLPASEATTLSRAAT